MPNFSTYFTPLISDIEVARDSIFIVQETYRFAGENEARMRPEFQDDQFLIRNVRAHKITAIISLHKVYDAGHGVNSVNHLIQWLYSNKSKFTKAGLIQRRVSQGQTMESAEEYALDVQDLSDESIRRLASIKRSLQSTYDRKVRDLRNWVFAHRVLAADASNLSVEHEVLAELGKGAYWIYQDVWQAYHNGRPFSFSSHDYQDNWDLGQSIAAYFQKYLRT